MVDEHTPIPTEDIENTGQSGLSAQRQRIAGLVAGRAEQLAQAGKSPPAEGALRSEAQMAENERRFHERNPKTSPEHYDENGKFLTWEEQEARRRAAAEARFAERARPEIASSPLSGMTLVIPEGGIADLLEQQAGICTALVNNIAQYVAQTNDPPSATLPYVDRISSLMQSSATAGRVVGHLRGIASETKQTFIRKDNAPREGGVRAP